MATVHEVTDVDVSFWGPRARMFAVEGGGHLVVNTDATPGGDLGDRIIYIPSPTMLFHTDETGHVTDLNLKQDFEPLTTHEQALEQAGFTLVTE